MHPKYRILVVASSSLIIIIIALSTVFFSGGRRDLLQNPSSEENKDITQQDQVHLLDDSWEHRITDAPEAPIEGTVDVFTVPDISDWEDYVDFELGVAFQHPPGAAVRSSSSTRSITVGHSVPGISEDAFAVVSLHKISSDAEMVDLLPDEAYEFSMGGLPALAYQEPTESNFSRPVRVLNTINDENFLILQTYQDPLVESVNLLSGLMYSLRTQDEIISHGPHFGSKNLYKVEKYFSTEGSAIHYHQEDEARLVHYNASGEREIILEDVVSTLKSMQPDLPEGHYSARLFHYDPKAVPSPDSLIFRFAETIGGTDAIYPIYLYRLRLDPFRIEDALPGGVDINWASFTNSPDGKRTAIHAHSDSFYDRLLVLNLHTGEIEHDDLLPPDQTLVFSESELGGHYIIPIQWLNENTLEYKAYLLPEKQVFYYDGQPYDDYRFPYYYDYQEFISPDMDEEERKQAYSEREKFVESIKYEKAVRIEKVEFE